MFATPRLRTLIAALSVSLLGLTLTSCVRTSSPVAAAIPVPGVALKGMVHGGQQPVKGSTIQLYAAGSNGDGSASTALLSHTVTTDASGNFNITGLYSCPSSSALVYIVSIGGDPGMGANNPNLAEMAALGPCGKLGASTFIVITEVTTVASVYELAPYMNSYSAVGYGTDLADLTAAFAAVNELANIATGTSPGTSLPTGTGVPVEQINTLADILASCVNSAGGIAGDNSTCGRLLSYAGLTGQADTIAAMLQIARNPSMNTSQLYSLLSPNSPFQPVLTSAPTTWNIAPAPFTTAPTISPNGGTFTSAQTITLADTASNATIYYTLDGSTPTLASPQYTGPFTLSSNTTVKAIAQATASLPSTVTSATFSITATSVPIITTVAGNGSAAYTGDGSAATLASINGATGVGVASNGTLYIADTQNHVIRKVIPGGIISTIAGNGSPTYAGDGGQATAASLNSPSGVAVDTTGNLFIADAGNNVIRKVTPAGVISTYAGNGSQDYSGDGGPATSAGLSNPTGVAITATGVLYIADYYNNVIRKVALDGTISTVAGTGTGDFSGDGGPATSADLQLPGGVALDANGDLFIADTANSVVRIVTPDGTINTYAGGGQDPTNLGDGGPSLGAFLGYPTSVATDATGNLFVADAGLNLIRKITPSGANISTITGTGQPGYAGDNGPAPQGQINQPGGVAVDANGNIFIGDTTNNRIREISLGTVTPPGTAVAPTFSPAAGTYTGAQTVTISSSTATAAIYYTTDGSTPTASSTPYTGSITVSSTETVAAIAIASGLADSAVTSADYTITTPTAAAPTFSPAAGTYTTAQLVTITNPNANGNYSIYFTTDGSDPTTSSPLYNFNPVQVLATQTLKAIVVTPGASNSPVASASYTINLPVAGTITNITPQVNITGFSNFQGLAVGSSGNILVSSPDPYGNGTIGGHIWQISPNGVLIAKAGGLENPGVSGYVPNVNVLSNPTAISARGDLVLDSRSPFCSTGGVVDRLQYFDLVTNVYDPGTAAEVCGSFPVSNPNTFQGYTDTTLNGPTGVAGSYPLYVSESTRIIKIGNASSLFGTYAAILAGPGTLSNTPYYPNHVTSLALNSAGLLHFIDTNVVGSLTDSGAIGLIAGSGTAGFSGDGGDPTKAKLSAPRAINFDAQGNLYIADTGNNRIRLISNGIITTIAGNGTAASTGDNGPATSASLNAPIGVAPDNLGNVYVIEGTSNIRRIYLGPPQLPTPTFTPVAGSYSSTQTVTLTASLPQAAIYYTTDGSTPTTSSTLYTGPITVSQSETVKAIAHVVGFTDSAPAGAAYTINLTAVAPVISPAGGYFTTYQPVSMSTTTPNAAIYYTTDRSTPTTASTLYTGPFTLKSTTIFNAIAVANGYLTSPITTAGININLPVAASPTIFPIAGDYSAPQTISIADNMYRFYGIPSTIFYTTDGSTPTNTSNVYFGPFTLAANGTVKAFATLNNYTDSPVTSQSYTFTASYVTASPGPDTYLTPQTVTLSSPTPNAIIYYTTDGTTPSIASTLYSGPITVSQTEIITAFATLPGFSPGKATANNYIIDPNAGYINTIAGAGTGLDGSAAYNAAINNYQGALALAPDGSLYFSEYLNADVRKISPAGVISTVAGSGPTSLCSAAGDGGPATSASLCRPHGIAVDAAGDIYIADSSNNRIRMVSPTGTISTIAGNGACTSTGDGALAVNSTLCTPYGLALDKNGNLLVAEYGGNRIRQIVPKGNITTIAGTGAAGNSGDGSAATLAKLHSPNQIAVDAANNIYFTDYANASVRKIASGTISTVYTQPGSFPVGPNGITVDPSGNLFFVSGGENIGSNILYKMTPAGVVTIATPAAFNLAYTGDGGLAVHAGVPGLGSVLSDATGNLYLTTDENYDVYLGPSVSFHRILKITLGGKASTAPVSFSPAEGTYTSVPTVTLTSATAGASIFYTTDGSIPTTASTRYTGPFLVNSTQRVFAIATSPGLNNAVLSSSLYTLNLPVAATPVFTPNSGTFTTSPQTITIAAGGGVVHYTTDGSTPTAASAGYVGNIVIQTTTTIKAIRIQDGYTNSAVATATFTINLPVVATPTIDLPSGTYPSSQGVSFISATSGASFRYTTDGSTPTATSTLVPAAGGLSFSAGGVSVLTSGTLRVAAFKLGYTPSAIASATYVITPPVNPGIITNYAGGGTGNYDTSYNGPATAANVDPNMIAIDNAGTMYVGELCAVRKITPAGVLSHFVGNQSCVNTGDGGQAANATLDSVYGVAVDGAGNVYIMSHAPTFGGFVLIRKVATNGVITRVAGTIDGTDTGDGTPAKTAQIDQGAIAVDSAGNIFVTGNSTIRKIGLDGIIHTIAGQLGVQGYAGDGGLAINATIDNPAGLATDKSGNLYIADSNNGKIRKITTTGTISTIAGVQLSTAITGSEGDGILATNALLVGPTYLAVDANNNVYVSQIDECRVRRIIQGGLITTVAGTPGIAPACGYSGDGGLATSALLAQPTGIAVDPSGNLFIADFNNGHVRKVTFAAPPPATLSASLLWVPSCAGSITRFDGITGSTLDSLDAPVTACAITQTGGMVYTLGGSNGTVYQYSSTGAPIKTLIASTSSSNVAYDPARITTGPDGNLYISQEQSNQVVRYNTSGTSLGVFATGATGTGLHSPVGMAFGSNAFYVADFQGQKILKYPLTGGSPTIVNPPCAGQVDSVLVAPSGDLLETNACGVYDVTTSTTFATGVPATQRGMRFGPDGFLYIASQEGQAIYRTSPQPGGTATVFVKSGYDAVDLEFVPVSTLTLPSQGVNTTSPAMAVLLSNTSATTLSISSIALSGANATEFHQTNTCGTSLAPGATCTIRVTLTPNATGTRSATLTVTDSSGTLSGATQTFPLTGTGT